MAYGLDNLPYASVVGTDGRRRAVVRFGDDVLDLTPLDSTLFADGTLDAFLGAGRQAWADVRGRAQETIEAGDTALTPLTTVRPVLGFAVADYVDFYASIHHATNAGRIFRPHGDALAPNWTVVPVGYHGRAGTVVASGTPVVRPTGQLDATTFAPTRALDFEAELGFVVGTPSTGAVGVADADEHVFGVCLLDDWSARDVQRFETQPLGPFLGKSFATSVSPWITPLAALQDARFPSVQTPAPADHLLDTGRHRLGIELTVRVNDTVLCRSSTTDLHWTYAQFVAHLTSNGAPLRTGDLLGSGTVSGPEPGSLGCLLEMTRNGAETVSLDDGGVRTWLEDGDEVVITGSAGPITLGEVRGRVAAG
ncbi:fumarylacetoacetate hydrolase family protein [uncultured Jatrophihabitans sp.]|uniref:fumarylacetoacetate hydrolase family protein n=1 Tax=uncultured Jatrophihabitans sp. TaxID=1610747 RepID=UPI0035CC74A7